MSKGGGGQPQDPASSSGDAGRNVTGCRRALRKAQQRAVPRPRYLRPRQRVGAPQLPDAALQQLRRPPEASREGVQPLRVGDAAGQRGRAGSGAREEEEDEEDEEEERCQARAGRTVGHRVQAEEEGSVEVDGWLEVGALSSRQEGVALLGSELSFPFPSPGLSRRFSRDV